MEKDDFELTVVFSTDELMEFLEDNETLCLDNEEDRETLAKNLTRWMERKTV